jgi:5'(3')-deoxyribonucleotidase
MNAAWLTQRAEWLEAFGVPLDQQIHTHCKHALSGTWDILIDDRAENCEAFERAGGRAFCIATPYNTQCTTVRGTHDECLRWLRLARVSRASRIPW